MKRVHLFLMSTVLAGTFLVLAGCGGEVERPGIPTPTGPTPSPEGTPLPTVVPTLPPLTGTQTPIPTPLPLLFLDVEGPEDGTSVPGDAVVVFGRTSPLARLTIDGDLVAVQADGRFQADVALSTGANRIEVTASAGLGEERVVLTVISLALPPQPFFLLITEPEDQTIVSRGTIPVTGRTVPDAVVTVEGVGVPVGELGIFSTSVTLEQGPNIIDVVATGPQGEQLSAVIAVIFRP